MKVLSYSLSALLVLNLMGCAHTPGRPATGLVQGSFWKDQSSRLALARGLAGKMLLHYEGKKESGTGQGWVISQLPNDTRLELRDPLGKLRYLVVLNGQQFMALYPTEQLAYLDDRAGNAYLEKLLGADFSFRDLQQIFVGILPGVLPGTGVEDWKWDSDNGVYRGYVAGKRYRYTIEVDGEMASLRKISWATSHQKVVVNYSDFKPCCGEASRQANVHSMGLAQVINVSQDEPKSLIELTWKEIRPLEKAANGEIFRVKVPEGTEKIALH